MLESLEKVCVNCSLITSVQNEEENDERKDDRRLDILDERVWPALKATRTHEHEFRSTKLRSEAGLASTELWFMLVCCPTLDRELNHHTTNYTQLHPAQLSAQQTSNLTARAESTQSSATDSSLHRERANELETHDD